jgi:hypothetical protein
MAQELRKIYDPPSLLDRLAGATPHNRQSILKESSVQRGQQARGAHEPDVITPSPWWMELQWASRQSHNPKKKLAQAVRDVMDQEDCRWTRPVAICQEKGSHTPIVRLFLSDLAKAAAGMPWGGIEITLDFEAFWEILCHENNSR